MNVVKTTRFAFVLCLLAVSNAYADVVYDWTGTCTTNCTGQASGVLTLQDSYTPGTAVSLSDLISWSYTSDTLSYTVPGLYAFLGVYNLTLPVNAGNVVMTADFNWIDFTDSPTTMQFDNSGTASGTWSTFYGTAGSNTGTNGFLTLRGGNVPAPVPMMLMMIGLAAIGLTRHKRA